MISQWEIRKFLLGQPHPAVVRLTTDGEVQELKPGRKSKIKIAETIAAVGPELVECLDGGGNLLRAMRTDDDPKPRSAKAPDLPDEIKADPHALMLTHFANLIHRAYEHATDIAFQKLVELAERMDARSQSIEERLERTEANLRREQKERIDDLYDRADEAIERAESGEGKERILESLVQGAVLGGNGAGKPTNGRSEE